MKKYELYNEHGRQRTWGETLGEALKADGVLYPAEYAHGTKTKEAVREKVKEVLCAERKTKYTRGSKADGETLNCVLRMENGKVIDVDAILVEQI
jgi:hypothetical protein